MLFYIVWFDSIVHYIYSLYSKLNTISCKNKTKTNAYSKRTTPKTSENKARTENETKRKEERTKEGNGKRKLKE